MSSHAPSKASGTTVPAGAGAHEAAPTERQLTRFVLTLIRPYGAWLVIVLVAMLVEVAMSLAAPWPLKLVLDDALGKHHLPDWLAWAHDYGIARNTLGVAVFAGLATVVIAVVAAVASYVDNYYTTSIGQWVANDLRIRIYEHLHRLSLGFYDTAKTCALIQFHSISRTKALQPIWRSIEPREESGSRWQRLKARRSIPSIDFGGPARVRSASGRRLWSCQS